MKVMLKLIVLILVIAGGVLAIICHFKYPLISPQEPTVNQQAEPTAETPMPPERIHLQWNGDASEVTWARKRVFDGDVEYVRADVATPIYSIRQILHVIATLETGGEADPDATLHRNADGQVVALGRYGIAEAFAIDGGMPIWSDAHHQGLAKQCIIRYWTRYCPKALLDNDIPVLLATHRYGPRGHERTDSEYVQKGEALLEGGG